MFSCFYDNLLFFRLNSLDYGEANYVTCSRNRSPDCDVDLACFRFNFRRFLDSSFKRKRFSAPLRYYKNSTATFQLALNRDRLKLNLLRCGDIQANPGPNNCCAQFSQLYQIRHYELEDSRRLSQLTFGFSQSDIVASYAVAAGPALFSLVHGSYDVGTCQLIIRRSTCSLNTQRQQYVYVYVRLGSLQ